MKILQRPPFLPVWWDLEGEYVEKTARILLLWHSKDSLGENSSGPYCIFSARSICFLNLLLYFWPL